MNHFHMRHFRFFCIIWKEIKAPFLFLVGVFLYQKKEREEVSFTS